MSKINRFTRHAGTRLQQRAIPYFVIVLLERFGTAIRCSGATRVIFDKKALKRLRHHLGGDRGLSLIDHWKKVYLVVSDEGALITAAHQTG